MTAAQDLKPCPFCGSSAIVSPIPDGHRVECMSPRCGACGPAVHCGPHACLVGKATAISVWNEWAKPVQAGTLLGVPIIYDPSLSPDVVEISDQKTGKVLARIQHDAAPEGERQ